MEELFLNFLYAHIDTFSTFGLYIIATSGILESIPFFGFIIPGQTILLFGGFITTLGVIDFKILLYISILSAFIGDTIAFVLGKYFGLSFLSKIGHGIIKPSYILETKKLIEKHPGKTIVIGRFNSLTRSLAPFISGTLDMKYRVFLIYAFVGAIIWGLTFSTLGILLGQTFLTLGLLIGKFIAFATLLIIIISAIIIYINKHGYTLTNRNAFLITLSTISLFIFASISQIIHSTEHSIFLDQKILNIIDSYKNTYLDISAKIITNLGDTFSVTIFTLIFILYFIYRKYYHRLTIFVLTMFISGTSTFIFKNFFDRLRPPKSEIIDATSYPSGHATLSTTLIVSIFLISLPHLKKRSVKIFYIYFSIILILLISTSRLILHKHYLLDVIAGMSLGIFISTTTYLFGHFIPWIYKKIKRKDILPNI